mmetsp:Transcript_36701/g.114228  ORF Transcript_36701/g.114228 Transcript_36701/m.114228 type:complete len:464 (+) Transcript_36701:3-1394(+)
MLKPGVPTHLLLGRKVSPEPMPCQWRRLLPLLALLFCRGATGELDSTPEAALGADDECVARSAEDCGLSALQRRGARLAEGQLGGRGAGAVNPPQDAGEEKGEQPTVGNGTAEQPQENPEPEKPEPPTPTKPPKVGAYQQCGGVGYEGPTECAEGFECWGSNQYYYQCRPAEEVSKNKWKIYDGSPALNESSKAPLLTFYMYRAQGPNDYPVRNVNTATLGGLMWYVHNEVVSCAYGDCEYVRRFGINRIVRYKVQTRATRPLYKAGMNFGLRYAYDHGQCTGPWVCEDQFEKYGYFVGCNNLSAGFPFPDWPVYYSGAWFSLPGPCSSKQWEEQNYFCQLDQPGGSCQGPPTGAGTCTYALSKAGEISLDELEGIDDYRSFKEDGGEEYNKTTDEGVNMTFWNEINNTQRNAERVKMANDLFKEKYPHLPSDEDLPPPPCDFDKAKFFPDGLPEEENEHTRD